MDTQTVFVTIRGIISTIINYKDVKNNKGLYDEILKLRGLANELYKENQRLLKENKDLKEKLEISNQLTVNETYQCYEIKEGNRNGFYCANCYDNNKKSIRLKYTIEYNGAKLYKCTNCNTNYFDAESE